MPIVIPVYKRSTMTSVSVQANISDAEGLLGIIRNFHDRLQELQLAGQNLLAVQADRATRVQDSEVLSNKLSERLDGLIESSETMIDRIENESTELTTADQVIQDLLKENEKLDALLQDRENAIAAKEPSSEEKLIGFAEEELDRRIGELSYLQQRLASTKQSYQTEWEDFKAELTAFDEKRTPYENITDHLEDMRLARCVGAQLALGADSSSSAIVRRLVDNHRNKIAYRDIQKKLTALQVQEKDLEDEIGGLVKQKQQLWRRCLDLENCLQENQDQPNEDVALRPAAAFADLSNLAEGLMSTSESDELELTCETNHGRLLHRCPKQTHLVVDLTAEEREELELLEQTDEHVGHAEHVDDIAPSTGLKEAPSTSLEDDIHPDVQETCAMIVEIILSILSTEHSTIKEEETTSQANVADEIFEREEPEAAKKSPEIEVLPTDTARAVTPEAQSFVAKFRKRVGLDRRSSSSQKLKTATRLTATGSTRQFPTTIFKKRR